MGDWYLFRLCGVWVACVGMPTLISLTLFFGKKGAYCEGYDYKRQAFLRLRISGRQ